MARAKSYGTGWHGQSLRHSNARRMGRAGGVYSNMSYSQLKNKGIVLKPNTDTDKDGVPNKEDCKPLNPREQGAIHDWIEKQKEKHRQHIEEQQEKTNKELDKKLADARAKKEELQKKLDKELELKKKEAELIVKQKELDDLTGKTASREKRAELVRKFKEKVAQGFAVAKREVAGSAEFYASLAKKHRQTTKRTHKRRRTSYKKRRKKRKTEYTLFG